MKQLLFVTALIFPLQLMSQSVSDKEKIYKDVFQELKGMLNDSLKPNFKRAVFATENAFLENKLDYARFDEHIKNLAYKAQNISKQMGLIYNESDKEKIEKFAAVFKIMTDTIKFYKTSTDTANYYASHPYLYDFDDFWGEKDWRQMFVTKLLLTHKGNCHSLPFLYKMICEEMGVKPYLAMAPNHIYIKIRSKKTGWYNTELTSGHFPIDAWIMASGYVHLSSVQNRIYMDTLSDHQSIAVCLIDLAKGYEKKFGDYGNSDFILKACDLALAYYPHYINGLILKAETLKRRFESQMSKQGVSYPSDAFHVPELKQLFEEMQNLYVKVHQLGYRKMPKEMYATWLAELVKEKEKYQNKELSNSLNSKGK
jgi:hypothetical protein